MSNMKREFEEEIEDSHYRQAGLTKETMAKISAWIENASKEQK